MSQFIPIFPLELVVYPGEPLHLHIFEPRYKQLINEIANSRDRFGIPDKKVRVGTDVNSWWIDPAKAAVVDAARGGKAP